MKSIKINFLRVCCSILFCITISICSAQKDGIQSITISNLESHLYFLAADELQGRAAGEPGLEIAANYLAAQAKKIGLKAVDDNKDYSQNYIIEETSCDMDKSMISISSASKDSIIMTEDFYLIVPPAFEDLNLSGEIVFGGYGVNSEKFNYNDFSEVDVKDKLVLIMDRAPMNESGTESKFDDFNWNDLQNFNYKYALYQLFKSKSYIIGL